MTLEDALDEQNKILKEMADNLKEIRRYVANKPTELDFLSVCQSVNSLLTEAKYPTLEVEILRSWGITGGESMGEIKKMVDDWVNYNNNAAIRDND